MNGYDLVGTVTDNWFFSRVHKDLYSCGNRMGTLAFRTVFDHNVKMTYENHHGEITIEMIFDNEVERFEIYEESEIERFHTEFNELLTRLIVQHIQKNSISLGSIESLLKQIGSELSYDFLNEVTDIIEADRCANEKYREKILSNLLKHLPGFDGIELFDNGDGFSGTARYHDIPGLFLAIEFPNNPDGVYVLKVRDTTAIFGGDEREFLIFSGGSMPDEFAFERVRSIENGLKIQLEHNNNRKGM